MASSNGDEWGTPASESDRALRAAIDAVLRHSTDPLVAFDLKSLLILDANAAAHRRLGVPPGALAGLPFCEVVEPIDQEGARAAKRLLTSGDIDSFGATRYVRQPDGGMAEIHIWVRLVTRPEPGLAWPRLKTNWDTHAAW
jgi:PAS domain-containing protein